MPSFGLSCSIKRTPTGGAILSLDLLPFCLSMFKGRVYRVHSQLKLIKTISKLSGRSFERLMRIEMEGHCLSACDRTHAEQLRWKDACNCQMKLQEQQQSHKLPNEKAARPELFKYFSILMTFTHLFTVYSYILNRTY